MEWTNAHAIYSQQHWQEFPMETLSFSAQDMTRKNIKIIMEKENKA